MQLEVFPNPLARARRAFPYVVVLQANVAALGRERIVAFLAARAQIGPIAGRLMPVVQVGGREFVLLMPSITNVPVTELRSPVGNLNAFRDRIVDAIDWTFLGL
jgi:toxin CcdB